MSYSSPAFCFRTQHSRPLLLWSSVCPSPNCPPLPPPLQGLEQDVLQAIDRAIEAVHNAAMRDGGKYSLEQRGVLQ